MNEDGHAGGAGPADDELNRGRGVIRTRVPGFTIRFAREGDEALVLSFIQHLAEYERLSSEVVATEGVLHEALFVRRQAEVIIGELNGAPVAFALFFHNFSTFLGKANLYLEDLFVEEEHRGRGLGQCMFACLAAIAIERGCERLDWWCLDWNEPSIAFYRRMGAKPMSDWTVYRIEETTLQVLASKL